MQEYQVNPVFKAALLVLHFYLYINELPDDVICNIAIYANDATLYSISDFLEQLELVSGFQLDL